MFLINNEYSHHRNERGDSFQDERVYPSGMANFRPVHNQTNWEKESGFLFRQNSKHLLEQDKWEMNRE